MKTLAVRVRYQNESALKIARFLEAHPKVRQVQLPGSRAVRTIYAPANCSTASAGLLSFELEGGVATADSFINHVTLPISAPSWAASRA